jgi:hypothetical protein
MLPGLRYPPGPAVLVVGHPGHELRVHRWLEVCRPRVHVLTDGSGRDRSARLGETTAVLTGAGATPGSVYGRISDAAVYTNLLSGRVDGFIALAEELADDFRDAGWVIADAAEGYNPTHDLCRMIVDAALRRLGRPLPNFEFVLAPGAPEGPAALSLELEDDALARKLAAARGYRGLQAEVTAVERLGIDALRREVLSPARPASESRDPPFYETFGRTRVADGQYGRPILYRPHVVHVADALRRWQKAA